jgi:hypothetical protein
MSREVVELVKQYMPNLSLSDYGKIFTDTTEFMKIGAGDIISLDGMHYLVIRDEAERSFGIEDPKYWVKRCLLLETGDRKILKLVFHERFPLELGQLKIDCYRSPEKEARILDLVRDDMRFMQGVTRRDENGNPVRILDVVSGGRLDAAVAAINAGHEEYFFQYFPDILKKYMESCRAVGFLHSHGETHGDIRRDHLWLEHNTGLYRWIDFDYTYDFEENPFGLDLFGLGSLLIFFVGKGLYTLPALEEKGVSPDVISSIGDGDFSLLYRNRVVNLRKLFPWIPLELNNILMHFASSSEVFYETVDEFLQDLEPCQHII